MNAINKKKGLGRGLEALFGGSAEMLSAAFQEEPPTTLSLKQLRPGKYQPRTKMNESALQELAASIRAQGVMQPILVRATEKGEYEIIAGERRFHAARIAQLEEVPVLVRDVSDQAAAAMALIENIQREDLNPLEEAQGIQRLLKEFEFTHEQAAQAVGRSRSAVSNTLRLLNLAPSVQGMLLADQLDMGHARALLAVDSATQITLANRVVNKQLSVRETEKLVANQLKPQSSNKSERGAKKQNQDLVRLEEELSDVLMATVKIKLKRKGQGQLIINFGSPDALEGVIMRLRGKEA